jgi:hypothetical protein
VILAAACDPFSGYGADGYDHWDLPLIREWWRDRESVTEWIGSRLRQWSVARVSQEWQRRQIAALNAFNQYMERRAELYLREYAFFILEKRSPQKGDILPELH